jgi:hypothetical protein
LVTVTLAEPKAVPRVGGAVAVMVAGPLFRPVTSPRGLIDATAASAGGTVQPTWFVQIWVLRSLKLQVAVSCTVVPLAIEESGGVIVIEVRIAEVTVTVAEPWLTDS